MQSPPIARPGLVSLAGALCLWGCAPAHHQADQGGTGTPPQSASLAALPTGDIAGAAFSQVGAEVGNPETDQAAAAEGARLFVKMNCAGCHGYQLKGGMGPDLTDHYWRYGGTPAAIYNSIYHGRPQGMPAWGRALPPEQIWQIVRYIQSLGGTVPADQYQAGLQGDEIKTGGAGAKQRTP